MFKLCSNNSTLPLLWPLFWSRVAFLNICQVWWKRFIMLKFLCAVLSWRLGEKSGVTLLDAFLSLSHVQFLLSCPCLLLNSLRHLSFVKVFHCLIVWLNGKVTKWPLREKRDSLGEIWRGLIHGSSFRCLSIVGMSKKTILFGVQKLMIVY